MKLGFNLLLWATHVTDAHAPVLEKLKAAGFDGVEIPIFEGDPAHFRALGERLDALGLKATAVTVLPAGKSCISPDARERQAALDHIEWAVECTAAFGGEVLAGPFHQTLGAFSGQGPTEAEFERCVEAHREAARLAAAADVALSVEPLNRFECYFLNTADQAAALVTAVDEPNYGYLYDTFHFNIEENCLPGAVARTVRHINHVHISENNRGAPGAGRIEFRAVIAALAAGGYDGWLTCEAFGSALPDLAAATKIWRPLFAKPEDVYLGALATMRDGLARAS